MEYVHISAKVENRIESLKKSGNAANLLAQKATRIIESLTSGDMWHIVHAISSYTKYGEKRIKNCRKYDLGCGYRLIAVKRGKNVFIPFLGTHDECQRWLEKNSRLKEVFVGKGTFLRIADPERTVADTSAGSVLTMREDESEDVLMLKLRDKDLRRVFSGLVEGTKTS